VVCTAQRGRTADPAGGYSDASVCSQPKAGAPQQGLSPLVETIGVTMGAAATYPEQAGPLLLVAVHAKRGMAPLVGAAVEHCRVCGLCIGVGVGCGDARFCSPAGSSALVGGMHSLAGQPQASEGASGSKVAWQCDRQPHTAVVVGCTSRPLTHPAGSDAPVAVSSATASGRPVYDCVGRYSALAQSVPDMCNALHILTQNYAGPYAGYATRYAWCHGLHKACTALRRGVPRSAQGLCSAAQGLGRHQGPLCSRLHACVSFPRAKTPCAALCSAVQATGAPLRTPNATLAA
jgi:hypothetical protein